jgi:uncharacterized protein (DUF952 family)
VTKSSHLQWNKITQVQVINEGYYEGMHFCNWFLWVINDDVLDQELKSKRQSEFKQFPHID